MAFCAKCGAQLQEGVAFCGSCGAPAGAAASGAAPAGGAAPAAAPASTSSGLTSNVAGMIAYITIIPAIIFLVMEPYNKDKYVRFHAFQSLFFNIAWFILVVAMMFVGIALGFIPVLGWILDILLWLVIGFGGFAIWVFLLVKAYGNQKFELPVIGKMAAQQAEK